MITEAIWEEKKYQKGSSRSFIRNFILDHYDVDEEKLKTNLSQTITKMLEEGDRGYPLLVKSEENFKLHPEWRKAWTKKYGKKSKTTRKRRKKASDEPKHPRNGYLFYTKDVRSKRQDQHPDKTFAELTKLIAEEWKSLGSKKKRKYEELAEEDRKRYKREMKDYEAKKRRRRNRDSGSDSDVSSSPPRRRSSRRKQQHSESSEDSRRSPKKRRRQSESDSGSRDRKDRRGRSDNDRRKSSNSDEEERGKKSDSKK